MAPVAQRFSKAGSADQRKHARHCMTLTGKLFVPAEQCEMNCIVTDLSAGGAGVQCEDPPCLETFTVLYVEGFGRFEAVTVRYVGGVLGLRFLCTERKRDRLKEKIARFKHEGAIDQTDLRKHPRTITAPSFTVMRPNGQQLSCEVLDISLQGLSLQTSSRPPIDEVLRVGRSYARVVRHHEKGIGVEFVDMEFTL